MLEGDYVPPQERSAGKDGRPSAAAVVCRKTYGTGGKAKRRHCGGEAKSASKGAKRRRRRASSDDDEDFDWNEERGDCSELIELAEDAELTIEDLRRIYYGSGVDGAAEGDGQGGKGGKNGDDDEGGVKDLKIDD